MQTPTKRAKYPNRNAHKHARRHAYAVPSMEILLANVRVSFIKFILSLSHFVHALVFVVHFGVVIIIATSTPQNVTFIFIILLQFFSENERVQD